MYIIYSINFARKFRHKKSTELLFTRIQVIFHEKEVVDGQSNLFKDFIFGLRKVHFSNH